MRITYCGRVWTLSQVGDNWQANASDMHVESVTLDCLIRAIEFVSSS